LVDTFLSDDDYEVPAILTGSLVLLPHMEIAVLVEGKEDLLALREAEKGRRLIAVIPFPSIVKGSIGTLTLIQKHAVLQSGAWEVLLKGLWRIRVQNALEDKGYRNVRFEVAEVFEEPSVEQPEVMKKVNQQIDEFVRLIPGIPQEIIAILKSAETPGKLADLCAYSPDFNREVRLDLLNTLDPIERLTKVSRLFDRQLHILKAAKQAEPISECEKCMEYVDRALEADPSERAEATLILLNHVITEHTGELLALLAERYGPIFMRRRALR